MPTDNMNGLTPTRAVAHETLIANLRNAHALEKQVIAVLEPQLKLLDDYPDLHAKLTQHIAETREQAQRLETALESCGSSPSTLKDALLSMMGLGQSSVQGFSSDAVLKAVVADMMTEHLEIATYRTLIVLAELAGRSDLCLTLELSLHEEETMADWFNQNLERLTRRFVELQAAAESAADSPMAGSTPMRDPTESRAPLHDIFDSSGARIAQRRPVAPTPGGPSNTATAQNAGSDEAPLFKGTR